VPTLAQLLLDPANADSARLALQTIPGAAVDQALLDALKQASTPVKLGIIGTLGERRNPSAVSALVPLLSAKDVNLANAAAQALGTIGGGDAIKALQKITRADVRASAAGALLKCAERMLADGNTAGAADLYQRVHQSYASMPVRCAALQGLAKTQGDAALSLILATLSGGDPDGEAAAALAAQQVAGSKATQALAAALQGLGPRAQAQLINALAVRGDKTALDAITGAAKSSDAALRLAAARALGVLGDASSVVPLAGLAAESGGTLGLAARRSLAGLCGPDIDAALVSALAAADKGQKIELIVALGARRAAGAAAPLLAAAASSDASVRAEAYRVLALLTGENHAAALIDRVIAETDDAARTEAEKALVAALRPLGDGAAQAKPVLDKLSKTRENIHAHGSLLRVLGQVESPSSLKALVAATKSRDAVVAATAIRALSEWPNPGPAAALLGLAKKTNDAGLKTTLLRGYLRMQAMPGAQAATDFTGAYEAAFAVADTPALKKIVLASLGNQPREECVPLALKYAADPDVREEAQAVADKVLRAGFKASAYNNQDDAANATDGDINTRWTSGEPQHEGQWFQIDFGVERSVYKVVLDSTPSAEDYPRGYEVYLSADGKDWGKPVASGAGAAPKVDIQFPPATGRYIRIVQTGKVEGRFWSIHELSIGIAF
jgi:HEAT repeat protein